MTGKDLWNIDDVKKQFRNYLNSLLINRVKIISFIEVVGIVGFRQVSEVIL